MNGRRVPPDGGYGWVIALCGFFYMFLLDGFMYSTGIFFNEFLLFFEADKAYASMAGAILHATHLIVGELRCKMCTH